MFDAFVQDHGISIANALEIPHSCTEPLECSIVMCKVWNWICALNWYWLMGLGDSLRWLSLWVECDPPFPAPDLEADLLTLLLVTGLGWCDHLVWPGGVSKNAWELFDLRTLKFSTVFRNCVFQYMGKIFCVEFQKGPLKFHTKCLTHILNDMYVIENWTFRSC